MYTNCLQIRNYFYWRLFQDPVLKSKQEEIQAKVIEILHKKASILTAAQSKPAPALNPALQQAIDSLVKSGPNLLSSLGKMSGGSGGGGGGEGNLGGYYANLYGGGGAAPAAAAGGGSDYGSGMMRNYAGM